MPRGIMVAVGAVIEDGEGKVLLVKHRPERGGYWRGRWICPGGSLEVGESIEEGIKREVREETQLKIDLVEALTPFERIVRAGDKVQLHVIYIDYKARLLGGELKPGSDVAEALWVDKARLPQIWEELHPDTQRLLKIARVV